jgi:uncharacterized membrane protein
MDWLIWAGYLTITVTVFRFGYMMGVEYAYKEYKTNDDDDKTFAAGTAAMAAIFWPITILILLGWRSCSQWDGRFYSLAESSPRVCVVTKL